MKILYVMHEYVYTLYIRAHMYMFTLFNYVIIFSSFSLSSSFSPRMHIQ